MNFFKAGLACIAFSVCLTGFAQTQTFRPASQGLLQTFQDPGAGPPSGFEVNFVSNGPLGKDWIYGSWLDSDSLVRSVGFRKGGKWVPVPFHVLGSHYTGDIVQYGDTMYIGGYFSKMILDKDSTVIQYASIVKVYNDSIWVAPYSLQFVEDLEVNGDSLLVWAGSYQSADTAIGGQHLLTMDGGSTWEYPYSIVHPTETIGFFGALSKLMMRKGNVYSLNNVGEGHFNGVVKWDGQQWLGYGEGIRGTFSQAADFTFYRNELYMSGSFTKKEDKRNPGEGIAKWNGSDWESVGGGLTSVGYELFEYKNTLFCRTDGDTFGDVYLPYLAGWDGYQWCGTPISYTGSIPPNFGFINDTLYVSYRYLPATANGTSLSYINYFDGDYLHGPNAICSTPGLGENEQIVAQEDIQVFPNPASDFLHISISQEIENASYELLSLDGKRIQNGVLIKGENTLKIAKKLGGVFLLKIETESSVVVKKVFFEK